MVIIPSWQCFRIARAVPKMSGLGFPAAWCEAPSISVGVKDAAVSGSFAWPNASQH